MKTIQACVAMLALSHAVAFAAPITVGAAPKGDAAVVASKIINKKTSICKKVEGAVRKPDGSISARCNGSEYLVFTVFNPKEGNTIEVAMNCTMAKKHLNIAC